MGVIELTDVATLHELAQLVHKAAEPIIVLDEGRDCFAVMSIAVLERLLFDSALMNSFACEHAQRGKGRS